MATSCFNNSTFSHSKNIKNITKEKKQHFVMKSESEKISEIRVCTNRTCRKQGSQETLEILSSLAPPSVSITSSGCLGRCGSGPNIVFLPQSVFVSHCATAARTAQVLAISIGRDDSNDEASKNLTALALRKRAEEEMDKGDFLKAENLLSQAIDLKPSGGLHITYKSRSSARLAVKDTLGALEDAKEALRLAPQYPQAYLCQGDAYLELEEVVAAEDSYSTALQIDPSIRRSKSFKARVLKLQDKLNASGMAS